MNVFLENGITCLDLHGERHPDVKDVVIDFTYRYQAVSYTHLTLPTSDLV